MTPEELTAIAEVVSDRMTTIVDALNALVDRVAALEKHPSNCTGYGTLLEWDIGNGRFCVDTEHNMCTDKILTDPRGVADQFTQEDLNYAEITFDTRDDTILTVKMSVEAIAAQEHKHRRYTS